jgi:hypothetical protein
MILDNKKSEIVVVASTSEKSLESTVNAVHPPQPEAGNVG